MNTATYQASGRVPLSLLPLSILGLLAILPCAWLYALAGTNIPVVLGFFAAMLYSFVLGLIVWALAVAAKVRNPRVMRTVGIVFSLAGWYAGWGFWGAFLATADDGATTAASVFRMAGLAAYDPVGMFTFAAGIAGSGGVRIGGWELPAFLVGLIWLGELALLLMLPPFMGRIRASQPFCEKSRSWAAEQVLPARFAALGAEDVDRLRADPALLCQLLQPIAADAPDYTELTLYHCQASDSYVSITHVRTQTGEDGRGAQKKELLIDYLRLAGIEPAALLQGLAHRGGDNGANAHGDAGERPVPPELAPALAHLQNGAHARALEAASPHIESDDAEVRTDALRICALACSNLERWAEAVGYWHRLFEHEGSAHNALQIATSCVMAGQLAAGIDWVEQAAALNTQLREGPIMQIWTGFVSALGRAGQERAALPYLDKIRQVYAEVGTTDSTILYMNRIPFFSAFLGNSWPLLRAALGAEQGRRWYEALLPSLDANGQQELSAFLDATFGTSAVE